MAIIYITIPKGRSRGIAGQCGTKQDWLKPRTGNPNVKGVSNQALCQPAARDSSTQPAGVALFHCCCELLTFLCDRYTLSKVPANIMGLSFSCSLFLSPGLSVCLSFSLLHPHSKMAFHSPLPINLLHEICYMVWALSAVYLGLDLPRYSALEP